MAEDLDARVADGLGRARPSVARGVVHDEDPVDELGDAADRLADETLLVERGHDDRDPLSLEHQAEAAAAPVADAAIGSTTSAAIAPSEEPDQRADEERRPARARRRLARRRRLDDPARLDALREVEQLARLEEVVLDRGRRASAVVITELRFDESAGAAGRGGRRVRDDRSLLPLRRADALVDLVELRVRTSRPGLEQRPSP